MADGSLVRVEVVELDGAGGRQISVADRATEQLRARADDIVAAIQQTSAIVQDGLNGTVHPDGWRVSSLQATFFGLTLTAESGVIVGKAAAGASFEVTLTVEWC